MTATDKATSGDADVPGALRNWFLLHFAVDIIFALPIFIAPCEVLGFFGWATVDPLAARLAAAALFGIGVESYLGRNASRESFKGMLQLKIIWSAFAAIGIAWSVWEGALLNASFGWMLFAVFAVFHVLWWYWLIKLQSVVAKK